MVEEVELEIIKNVQSHVESILGRLGLDTAGLNITVKCMGSRKYGCAVKTSDLDLYCIIPDDWVTHAKLIRVLLAAELVRYEEAKDGTNAPVDQPDNCTLKWSHPCGLDVSLLVAVMSVVGDAVSATECLVWHFACDNALQGIVRETVMLLRDKGVLNSHGRNGRVGQSLKTTTAALLCVALLRSDECDRSATAEQLRAWLLRALSTFDSSACCVWYDYTEERVWCCKGSVSQYDGCPLRIMRRGRNSAGRLTVPEWARFQYACFELSGSSDSPPFASFKKEGPHSVECSPWPYSPRHVRFHLPSSWDWASKEEDFAVLSVWPGSGVGTLLVASGAGNDVECNIKGYKCIVTVTWCKSYTSNPYWFPDMLISVANCLCRPNGERLDVLALSRGVQGVMCCYDIKNGRVDAVIDSVNNVVLAGGCIWQRQERHLPGRILQGLSRVAAVWFRAPLRAVVVSEMDFNVLKRGNVSKQDSKKKKKNRDEKKGDDGYRVDYADFSEQVGDFTQSLSVLSFGGHGAVMSAGKTITEALKLTLTCGARAEADFLFGDLEAVLMRRLEGTSRDGAEAEGVPRLRPRSVGRPTAPRVVAEARGTRDHVFSLGLESKGQLPQEVEEDLQLLVQTQLRDREALWCFGNTGVGKSRRIPLAALTVEDDPKGVAHVMPRKIAASNIAEFYEKSANEVVQTMVFIWNGDAKYAPRQREFVEIITPVSFYHRLRSASSWQDLSLIVFDEIHVKDGMMALLIVYVLALIHRGAPCARGVRVLLMTATPEGPAYSVLKTVLEMMGISAGELTLLPGVDWQEFERIPLWRVVEQPYGWDDLNQSSKVCAALVLMTDYLWNEHNQSASILIFAAGEKEVNSLYYAILFSPRLEKVSWKFDVMMLWGSCPLHMESEVHERMKAHDFNSGCPAFFLILTPGKGEDSWTPRSNGVINCSEQMNLDDLGFLHKVWSDKSSDKQREGRVGRVARSLVLHLADGVEPANKWVMPYAERLQVRLAAMDLGVSGELPGLSAAQQEEAEVDLVNGDIVFKIGVVGDPSSLLFLFLSVGFPCMVIEMSANCACPVPATAFVLISLEIVPDCR